MTKIIVKEDSIEVAVRVNATITEFDKYTIKPISKIATRIHLS